MPKKLKPWQLQLLEQRVKIKSGQWLELELKQRVKIEIEPGQWLEQELGQWLELEGGEKMKQLLKQELKVRQGQLPQLPSSPLNQLDYLFPEEWRNDLETQIKRMTKAGKPEQLIKLKQIKVRLIWVLVSILIKLENLWLTKKRRS